MDNIQFLVLILAMALFGSCDKETNDPEPMDPYEATFDFDEHTENWHGGFSDFPAGEANRFELKFKHTTLPAPLDTTEGALMISGTNLSDDLFMYVHHRTEDLIPNSTYNVYFDVTLASDAADESVGIGGSPATSVYLKAGVVNFKPDTTVGDQNYYWLNLDKGNQSQDGDNMINIGNVANGTDKFEYALIERGNDTPFTFNTGPEGQAWILIGTDSGFEGNTELYYDRIKITMNKVE